MARGGKRKHTKPVKRKYDNVKAVNYKRRKPEKEAPPVREELSSESEEEVDYAKLLRESFKPKSSTKSAAIDSSDDEAPIENNRTGDSDEEKEFAEAAPHESEPSSETEDSDVEQADENECDIQEDEDFDDREDPFVKHVFYDLHDKNLQSLQDTPPSVDNHTLDWPELGQLLVQIPKHEAVVEEQSKLILEESKVYAPGGSVPTKIDMETCKLQDLFVKSQIVGNVIKANPAANAGVTFTPLQTELFSIINNYQDLYCTERNFDNAEEIRFTYCLHAVNHIMKTRMKVIHHNARLSKKAEVPEEFRDQGLVRPKVLILLPFKDSAYKVVRMIVNILLKEDKGNVINKKRFVQEYTGNELVMPKKNPKPEDFQLTFTGNPSDDFRIGMTVTKKSLKLYADFYSSDIIVASPLGLRTIIGAQGESQRDFDFLASIELLIMDQTEIFYMQNWLHLLHLFDHMHLQPKESHGTDFFRVRTWCLNGWAKYYRQTLMFSSIILPDMVAIFNKRCLNYAGKVRVANVIKSGSIRNVFVHLSHVFHRFEVNNIKETLDARFDFFIKKILPRHKESEMKQTLIYVSTYYDFVRLRNYFNKEDIGFVQICEYTKEGKVARARDMFYHGEAHFLLYTERYHFFNRINLKGIRHLVFYQPPNFPQFYSEMCNLMREENMNRKVGHMLNMSVTVLHSKYDIYQLSAIMDTERAAKITESERNVHMVVTEAD